MARTKADVKALPNKFKFFSVRVFGAWVDGYVKRIGDKYMVIEAYFGGFSWTEKRPFDIDLYYTSPHPLALNPDTQLIK